MSGFIIRYASDGSGLASSYTLAQFNALRAKSGLPGITQEQFNQEPGWMMGDDGVTS
jgi:hypothetical protein